MSDSDLPCRPVVSHRSVHRAIRPGVAWLTVPVGDSMTVTWPAAMARYKWVMSSSCCLYGLKGKPNVGSDGSMAVYARGADRQLNSKEGDATRRDKASGLIAMLPARVRRGRTCSLRLKARFRVMRILASANSLEDE